MKVSPMARDTQGYWALALVAAVSLWRFALLAFAPPDLSFDEAQYWAWAQHLQLGYYSKPPMVAWAIAATTALFGEGEGAIKLGSALAHTGTALLLYVLGRDLYGSRVGAWAAAGWILMPAVSLSAVMITTDPFLLFFWAAALVCLVRAERAGPDFNGWWLGLGLALGFGLLSKYAMGFFLLGLGLWLAWDHPRRVLLRARGLWLALAVGLAVYAPNGVWNALNGFVSYAHTRDNANLGGKLFNPAKLLEFVIGQFGVFGPVVMVALVLALAAVLHNRAPYQDGRARMLAAFTLPVLTIMTVESLLSRANANWSAPAYVAGSVLAAAYLVHRAPRWLAVSLAVHVLAAGVLYNSDWARAAIGLPDLARYDLEKRLKGWEEVGARVSAVLAAHPGARLLGDERKVLATLTYYVSPHPFNAVKWNPNGAIHDHFDQTTRLEPGTAEWIYVTERPLMGDDMAARFAQVERLENIAIPIHADYVRAVTVWRLSGFKGY